MKLPSQNHLLLALPLCGLAAQLCTARSYGYFRDELYYIACSEHLAWGYVDHPPLSIFVLWLVRHVLGDSLHALRVVPALAYAATVFLNGWICGRLGGGRFAATVAMLSAAIAPFYLFVGHVYSMNALDVLLWTVSSALLVTLFDDASPRLWLLLGLVLGLGLLDKISVLWLGFGLVIGLRLSPQKGWYMTPWPWISGVIAFLCFSPHVAWQVAHGWPTLQFMRNAGQIKMTAFSPWGFLLEQLFLMSPPTVLVALGGLLWLLAGEGRRKFRGLGLIFLVVLGVLLAFPSKPSYLGPAYALLIPAGGLALERLLARRGGAFLRPAALALVGVSGILLAPFALPVLPLPAYFAYARALGVVPSSGERHALGALPQHYADMLGWEAIVASVARAYRELPAEEREHAGIFAQNYGEAGAIDFFGRKLGLPRAMSGHNSYWYWGPDARVRDVVVVLGGDREDNEEVCAELEQVATIDCGLCMPYENSQAVYVCRGLRTPLPSLWPRLKRFI